MTSRVHFLLLLKDVACLQFDGENENEKERVDERIYVRCFGTVVKVQRQRQVDDENEDNAPEHVNLWLDDSTAVLRIRVPLALLRLDANNSVACSQTINNCKYDKFEFLGAYVECCGAVERCRWADRDVDSHCFVSATSLAVRSEPLVEVLHYLEAVELYRRMYAKQLRVYGVPKSIDIAKPLCARGIELSQSQEYSDSTQSSSSSSTIQTFSDDSERDLATLPPLAHSDRTPGDVASNVVAMIGRHSGSGGISIDRISCAMPSVSRAELIKHVERLMLNGMIYQRNAKYFPL
jgi:hypothetical protein